MFTRNHVTELLEERWLACYRVYDDNPKHALNSFDNNESDRFDKLTGLSEEKALETYHKILADEIQGLIQHIQSMGMSLADIELCIAEITANDERERHT